MDRLKSLLSKLNCFGTKAKPDTPADSKQPKEGATIPAEPKNLTEVQQKNKKDYEEYFENQRKSLTVLKTTTHADGRVIDWIPIKSQANGNIASPPPLPSSPPEWKDQPTLRPKAELEVDGAEHGPAGTVPVPRQNMAQLDLNQSLQSRLAKTPPVDPSHAVPAAAAAQPHWYASSAQAVTNHGGAATFSIFKPYTQSNSDFSLLQTAVIKYNVPKPGDNSQSTSQTVEAGW